VNEGIPVHIGLEMKFGLIERKPKQQNLKANEPAKVAVASIFEEDEDEEDKKDFKSSYDENDNKNKAKTAVSTSITNSDDLVAKLHEEAIKEDVNIFDYDASVDSRKSISKQTNGQVGAKDSKYMKKLLAKAEERKIETELIKLRNMKRKAANEGETEKEDEVFVTAAYTERLKELEEKERELKLRQANEDDGDVSKRKDMSGFYYNLMNRNVSFGAGSKKLKEEKAKKHEEEEKKEEETFIEQPPQAQTHEEEIVSFGPKRPITKK
jgi:coiled-coil domain-containing protein 55